MGYIKRRSKIKMEAGTSSSSFPQPQPPAAEDILQKETYPGIFLCLVSLGETVVKRVKGGTQSCLESLPNQLDWVAESQRALLRSAINSHFESSFTLSPLPPKTHTYTPIIQV